MSKSTLSKKPDHLKDQAPALSGKIKVLYLFSPGMNTSGNGGSDSERDLILEGLLQENDLEVIVCQDMFTAFPHLHSSPANFAALIVNGRIFVGEFKKDSTVNGDEPTAETTVYKSFRNNHREIPAIVIARQNREAKLLAKAKDSQLKVLKNEGIVYEGITSALLRFFPTRFTPRGSS